METGIETSTRGFEKQDPKWHTLMDQASSVAEVVDLTRDFIATITPQEFRELPERARPLRVKSQEDIEYWTWRLSSVPASDGPGAEIAHNIFTHFLHATMRLAQVHRAQAEARRQD